MRKKNQDVSPLSRMGSGEIVTIHGPLDRWGSIRLKFKVFGRIANGCRRLILDLKRSPYVDSEGIRTIKNVMETNPDVTLQIRNANPKVQRTLSLMHMEHLLSAA